MDVGNDMMKPEPGSGPMATDGPEPGQELRRRSGRKRNTPPTLYVPGDHESTKKRRVIGFSKRKKTATDELEPEPEPDTQPEKKLKTEVIKKAVEVKKTVTAQIIKMVKSELNGLTGTSKKLITAAINFIKDEVLPHTTTIITREMIKNFLIESKEDLFGVRVKDISLVRKMLERDNPGEYQGPALYGCGTGKSPGYNKFHASYTTQNEIYYKFYIWCTDEGREAGPLVRCWGTKVPCGFKLATKIGGTKPPNGGRGLNHEMEHCVPCVRQALSNLLAQKRTIKGDEESKFRKYHMILLELFKGNDIGADEKEKEILVYYIMCMLRRQQVINGLPSISLFNQVKCGSDLLKVVFTNLSYGGGTFMSFEMEDNPDCAREIMKIMCHDHGSKTMGPCNMMGGLNEKSIFHKDKKDLLRQYYEISYVNYREKISPQDFKVLIDQAVKEAETWWGYKENEKADILIEQCVKIKEKYNELFNDLKLDAVDTSIDAVEAGKILSGICLAASICVMTVVMNSTYSDLEIKVERTPELYSWSKQAIAFLKAKYDLLLKPEIKKHIHEKVDGLKIICDGNQSTLDYLDMQDETISDLREVRKGERGQTGSGENKMFGGADPPPLPESPLRSPQRRSTVRSPQGYSPIRSPEPSPQRSSPEPSSPQGYSPIRSPQRSSPEPSPQRSSPQGYSPIRSPEPSPQGYSPIRSPSQFMVQRSPGQLIDPPALPGGSSGTQSTPNQLPPPLPRSSGSRSSGSRSSGKTFSPPFSNEKSPATGEKTTGEAKKETGEAKNLLLEFQGEQGEQGEQDEPTTLLLPADESGAGHTDESDGESGAGHTDESDGESGAGHTDESDGESEEEHTDESEDDEHVGEPDGIAGEWEALLKKLEEDFGGMDSEGKIGEGEYFLEILDRFEGNVEHDIIDEITDENITKITEDLGDILEQMFPENNTAIWDYDENFDYFLKIIDTDDEEVYEEINISEGIRDISDLYQKITDIINQRFSPPPLPPRGKKKKTKKRRKKKTKKKSIKRKTIKKKSKKKKSKKKKSKKKKSKNLTKKKDLVDQIIQRLGY